MADIQSQITEALNTSGQAAKARFDDASRTVRAEAAHFADIARTQAAARIDDNKERLGAAITALAETIRRAGEDLGRREQKVAARLIDQASDGLSGLTRSLSHKDSRKVMAAAGTFGRRNPALLVVGALAAGVAIGLVARGAAKAAAEKARELGQDVTADDPTDDSLAIGLGPDAVPDVGDRPFRPN